MLRDRVRIRARFACEFCEVTETDTGGELTIDHFHHAVMRIRSGRQLPRGAESRR